MDIILRDELIAVPDLRHEVRRLRWFREAFRRIGEKIAAENGLAVAIDTPVLTECFLNWIDRFSGQKSLAALDRRDFAAFAAGLLLKELLRTRPIRLRRLEGSGPAVTKGPSAAIVDFWPEGFLYTSFCLCVLNAVHQQEFHKPLEVSPLIDDLRVWWSYRENIQEDVSTAIGFFDTFLGNMPNWHAPDYARARPAMRKVMESQAPEPAPPKLG
jgi:hypothetical protein